MSEERIKLQLRKAKLLEAIEDTKKKKEKITLIVQSLVKELDSGIIRRGEYEEKLNAVLKNRTAEQWIKYYDDYIDYYNYQIKLCERLINESKKKEKLGKKEQLKEKTTIYGGWEDKKRKIKLAPILIILIGIVLIAIFVSLFADTGVVVKGFEKIGEKAVNIFEAVGGGEGIREREWMIGEEGIRGGELLENRGGGRIDTGEGVVQEAPIKGMYNLEVKQYQAVVGQPVKWNQTILVGLNEDLNIKLPEESKNINVKKIEEGIGEDVTESVDINEEFFGKEINVRLKNSKITGNAIENSLDIGRQTFEIIYETPAPEIEVIQQGLRTNLRITGPDDVHYESVLSFADIPEVLEIGEQDKLKLYQTKRDGIEDKKQIPLTLYDTDENGLYDTVEWVTPELSDWEGYIIIEISKAEHLDENKEFISDIYEQVKAVDDIWSETINKNEYVKVSFEKRLSNLNDITIYLRVVSGNPRIEVYEGEGDEIIAEFESLVEGKNTIYLTNLPEGYTQDVFDLKVINGAVKFDYIVDPDWTWHPSLSSWTEKERINITNSIGALTNYQVKLNVIYALGMQTDFDDLRFTNYDDDTLLDYWIEDMSIGVSAEVWVKVPSIAATPAETIIYMYYGNAGVGIGSNIDDTFIMADKFLSPIWTNSYGGDTSCAITSTGTVTCVGLDDMGQRSGASGVSNAVSLALGYYHGCALRSDGTVSCWGGNQYGQLGRSCGATCGAGLVSGLTNVVSISLGNIHSCVLLNDGDVYCWGKNGMGAVGDNCNADYCTTPVKITGVVDTSVVKGIFSGGYHSCAIISNEDVYCWGNSQFGQASAACNAEGCRDYATLCCETPVKVTELGTSNVRSLGLGDTHSCALIDTGNVYCWGRNNYGQAPGSLGITSARGISSAYLHSCALLSNGNVRCWGDNYYGQAPASLGITNAVSVATGWYHSCALLSNGNVRCWGDNYFAQAPNPFPSYTLGGRFDKDDQFGTAYDIPDYGIDDFFVRAYATAEPGYYFGTCLNECDPANLCADSDTKIDCVLQGDGCYDQVNPVDCVGDETCVSGVCLDATAPIITLNSIGGDTRYPFSTNDNAPDINVTTHENADCRASIDGDEDYDSMVDDVSCITSDGTTHECDFLTVIPDTDLQLIYVACNDGVGNKNNNTNNLDNFTEIDTLPPALLDWSPAEGSSLSSFSQTITFTISEFGDCKWSLSDLSYAGMAGDCIGDGTTDHSCDVTGMQIGPEIVYIACSDDTDSVPNTHSPATNQHINYNIDVEAPLVFFTDPTEETGNIFKNYISINVTADDSGRGNSNLSTFIDFDNSLISWWRMDDTNGSANSVLDYTGVNNGTAQGGAVQTNDGKLGKGFELDGIDDYINLGNDASLQVNEFTAGGWFYPREVGRSFYNAYITKAWNQDPSIYLGTNTTGSLVFYLRNSVPSNYEFISGSIPAEEEWIHVMVVYDGNNMKLYENGLIRSSKAYSASKLIGGDWLIGLAINDIFLKDQLFNGSVDEVMVFDRALSQEEIIGLYANTSKKYLFKNFTDLDFGNYTFKAYAQDAAGNVNVTEEREIKIKEDDVAPLIFFTNPTPPTGNIFDNFIPINISASDAGRGNNNISTFIDFNRNLIGWWRMDDTNGSVNSVVDYMGRNNGTAQGNAVQTSAGKLGKGFVFDGNGDYVDVPDANNLDINSQVTLGAWVKFNYIASTPSYQYILAKRGTLLDLEGNYDLRIYTNSTGNYIDFYYRNATGWQVYRTPKADLIINKWYYIAATYNFGNGASIKIYLNNNQMPSVPWLLGTGNSIPILNNKPVTIGGLTDNYYFNGTIDDVMIFKRALSQEEITGLYANTSSKYLFQNFINLEIGNYTFKAYAQDIIGNVNVTEEREVKISTNAAPIITSWTVNSDSPTSCTITTIDYTNNFFRILVSDANGWEDMQTGGSVSVYFGKNGVYRPGGGTPAPISCIYSGNDGGDIAYYDCSIDMNYYDEAGDWTLTVTATDGDLSATPESSDGTANYPYFNYISSLILRPSEEPVVGSDDNTLSWDEIQTTSADEPADNHLKVENCGNADFASVSITGQDLTGTGGNTDTIEPDSFYVDETSNPCGDGQQILNPGPGLIITNTALAKGTGAGIPSENIYFCLKDINPVSGPSPIKVDSYSSSSAWDISVTGIIISLIKFIRFNFEFSILLSLVVLRTKKKRKKKSQTKKNLLSYKDLLNLDLLLKKDYNISVKELLRKSKEKEIKKELDIKIPLNIFNKKLSPAEALCKYLKENKKMKFSEIARLINRDERSIWTNYNNAVKKIKEKIKDEKKADKTSLVFINIFADRRLSILESIVKHLKEKGFRNYKIAELLGKDQRNIYTIYNRVNKKLN